MLHQRKDLRHKNFVDPGKTDRELFADLELGDCWSDANLAKTYFYARENRHLHIPESWTQTMADFDSALSSRALHLHSLHLFKSILPYVPKFKSDHMR